MPLYDSLSRLDSIIKHEIIHIAAYLYIGASHISPPFYPLIAPTMMPLIK